MSTTRRVPLSNNPNVANSPMRASTASLHGTKKVRSHAELLREEPYGQPPPAKRQMIDRAVASPTRIKTTRTIVHRNTSRATAAPASRVSQTAHHYKDYKPSPSELDSISAWKNQMRERIPKMVFYFEGIPDDHRTRLSKQVAILGAREEKFFSINITHIVTARQIPPQKMAPNEDEAADGHSTSEQLKTIDPSLLNRINEAPSVRRKLVFDAAQSRRVLPPVQEDPIKRPKLRNADVLHRAREMGKKIWSVEKLQKIIEVMLEPDLVKSAVIGRTGGSKASGQTNLRQALENERVHGPSDRDPTAPTIKDMYIFKGPYIYIYDMEEKTKPILVREYPKVQDKKDGEWPQFRVASQGRCPFVEDIEPPAEKSRNRNKEKAAKAAEEAAAKTQQPPEVPPPKPATGKRSIAEMEEGQNRHTHEWDRPSASAAQMADFRTQNAFMSHAKAGRLLGGEPVASGVNPSNVTSAIRSQMISSTGGVLGAKAGTSKEIHGLQRKVLQKASTPAVSQQDLSSRRLAEVDHDSGMTFLRSASAGNMTHKKLDAVEEEEGTKPREKLRRTVSVPVTRTAAKKRDPKPGYCENCLDKFDDFDEHIQTRKHRKFAENEDNWAELDALLTHLKRRPRTHEVDW
ncbi:Dfp1/Him1, central region-domain-containing protein [Podospora fimiseda]|uniref:Dfp1/Him1, central region-domain-containing protein n=1 Tax=Podospora fimiseda TaxID=252190 RepID=A0AAN7H939_9PEZI|nr:Dfp1/Him1, central region-domain-containing protein [Podospora fimiseda]